MRFRRGGSAHSEHWDGHGDGFFLDAYTDVMHNFLHGDLLSLLDEFWRDKSSHIADRLAHTGKPRSEFKHAFYLFAEPQGLAGIIT